jgi:hypothetical protein
MMMSLQQSQPTPPPPYVSPQWRPAELRFVDEPKDRRWMGIVAAIVGVVALVAVGVLMVPNMVGDGSVPATPASYQTWGASPSGQAFAEAMRTKVNTPVGCAAYADAVSRISTDGLPEVAITPMNNVVAALRAVATACQSGDEAATARAGWQVLSAIAALSNTPGVNMKG